MPEQDYNVFDLGYNRDLIKEEIQDDSGETINRRIKGGKASFGSLNSTMRFQGDTGLWLGDEDFSNAPFGVDMDGNISGSSFSLSSISGDLDDVSDGSTYGKVASTNISSGNIVLQTDQNLGSQGIKVITASSGARVEILPDSNTGIQIIDDSSNNVFEALVSGTDVGDVTIGDYASNQGLKYDKSAGTTTFKGNITASTITGSSLKTAPATGIEVFIQNDVVKVREDVSGNYKELVLFQKGGGNTGIFKLGDTGGTTRFQVDYNSTDSRVQVAANGSGDSLYFDCNTNNYVFEGYADVSPNSGDNGSCGTANKYWYDVHYGTGGLVSHSSPLPKIKESYDIVNSMRNRGKGFNKKNQHAKIKTEGGGTNMDVLIRALVKTTQDIDKRLSKLEKQYAQQRIH